jgi:hypothetical protein
VRVLGDAVGDDDAGDIVEGIGVGARVTGDDEMGGDAVGTLVGAPPKHVTLSVNSPAEDPNPST